MLKLVYFIFVASFIIEFLIFRCTSFSCVHDQVVQPGIKASMSLRRSVKYQDIRKQRDRSSKSFEPLNVFFYIDNFDLSIPFNVIHNLELALEKVQAFIATTFKVNKRKKPFLLERHACTRRWQAGPNQGKCSKITNEPENCVSQEIIYPIPNRFLDKLELYDYDTVKPRYEIPPGSGLESSNFITFVTSESSSLCEGSDVSAFGTYCRLESKTNEPLAGILNLCPGYFVRKQYPSEHYYNVILHEMFHILGFSIHLFEKIVPCRRGIYCDIPKNLIQIDSFDIPRLMLPAVIHHMQKHFSCVDADFGAPLVLDAMNSTEEEEDAKEHITSHWDPVIMYSSIMMPNFSEYDKVFVDNITLSVFENTGWYLVNYSQADSFRFGKDQGCEFGVNTTCDDNMFLCDPKTDKLGCDLTHNSFGRCTALSPHHSCGVYQSFNMESCEMKYGKEFGLDFYALGYQHKCFMLSNGDDNVTAECLPVKCRSSISYSVLVNMSWYECYSQYKVNIRDASILCPEASLFCKGDVREPKLRQYCPAEINFFIAVRMHFVRPTFDELRKEQSYKNFKVTTLKRIAEELDIPVNYIVNSSLSLFKKIQLDFIICPTLLKTEHELNNIVSKVQAFLDAGLFMHILSPNTIVSSSNVKTDPLNAISFSDHEGFRTLLIFPALCAIFLVATVVASIMRLFITRKHY